MKSHLILALLPLALCAGPGAADTIAPGFTSTPVPFPTGATIRNLSDGSLITCDGTRVQRWLPSGTFVSTLAQFSTPGTVGAMVIDPTETFVIVGNATSGDILRVNLTGTGQALIADLPGNHDAAFESSTSAIVSVEICAKTCATALVRLDVFTGNAVSLVATVGAAGPVALDGKNDLYYGSPAGGDLTRFGAGTLASPPTPAFQANNGLVVIEVESAPPAGDWDVETTYPGYTGASYYRWNGPDLFGSPGSGVLSYDFEVTEAGNYVFHYHNRHEHPAPDMANDAWVKVDDGQWIKIFSNAGAPSVGQWNWFSIAEVGSQQFEPNYNLSVGRHNVQISGRSKGFAIDRMVFYRPTVPAPMDLTYAESIKASFNETDGQAVASDLVGPTEMVHEPELDVFFLAEQASGGANRIRRMTPNGLSAVMVQGDPFQTLRNLDFTPQHGLGTFSGFQPPGNGTLAYSRTAAGLNEHRVLTPRRPTIAFTGPGATTGIGPVTVTLQNAFPSGLAAFMLAPAAAVAPSEGVLYLPSLAPIFVGLLPSAASLYPLTLQCNPAGTASFTLAAPFGAPDLLGVQAIAFDANGKVLGTSAADVL